MKRSDKFKKFSDISSGLENTAGVELAAAQKQLKAHQEQLSELERYLNDYQQQLNSKLKNSDSALVIQGYQQFISSINGAISLQTEAVRKTQRTTEELKNHWIERKREVKKFDRAAENILSEEDKLEKKTEQSENDERVLNGFRQAQILNGLEISS